MERSTKERIVYGILMAIITSLFLLEKIFFALFFSALIVAIFWEIYINFFKQELDRLGMFISLIILGGGPFIMVVGKAYLNIYSLFITILLALTMLFRCPLHFLKRAPYLLLPLLLAPLISMMLLLQQYSWRKYLILLFLLSFGNDIAAFVWGKKYGRHPLTEISPHKTQEGLLFAGLTIYPLATIFYLSMIKFNLLSIILFLPLPFLGQLGDITQSYFKRSFHLKDSSTIIPGHGGIFDRLDSLLFLAPFYMLIIKIL